MKDLFVPYELAVKLKEKGFDNECISAYQNPGENLWSPSYNSEIKNSKLQAYYKGDLSTPITAPLWQQAIDWLEENHNLILVPHHRINGDIKNYWYSISRFEKGASGIQAGVVGMIEIGCHGSNKSAIQAGIEKALELIK